MRARLPGFRSRQMAQLASLFPRTARACDTGRMDIASPQAAEDWLGDWRLDRSRSIKRQVYATLRRAIVEGKLLPRRGLSEQEFAEPLGGRPTAVREALSQPADDLLVSIL